MIIHVCSHFGDLEVEADGMDKSILRYMRLTPKERMALDQFLAAHGLDQATCEKGEYHLDLPVVEVGAALGEALHTGQAPLSAIRFSTGTIAVEKRPLRDFLGSLFHRHKSIPPTITPATPEAAVEVPMPTRGCPMPTPTELKEHKAAAVVRKFLVGQQVADFDRQRAFLAVGGDSGRLYRVTSRWSPKAAHYGVLYDLSRERRICASNLAVPPSEEVLSILFAVEHFETDFIGS